MLFGAPINATSKNFGQKVVLIGPPVLYYTLAPEKVCGHLSQEKDYTNLLGLLEKIPSEMDHNFNQNLNRTKCFLYFRQGHHKELFSLLKTVNFDEEYHR